MRDGPGLSAWDLAAARMAGQDEERRMWLDAELARGSGDACHFCGRPTTSSRGCCSRQSCITAWKRDAHRRSAGSGDVCECGCDRRRT